MSPVSLLEWLIDAWWTVYFGALLLWELALERVSALLHSLQIRSPHNQTTARHERSAHIHGHATLGERLADAVASGMGSWRFIILQTLLVLVWMLANAWLLTRPFDPYPFILLNLAFSTQAAYAAPILQMASNRQAAKDRLRDDREAQEVDLMARQLKLLETINRQQLAILKALRPRDHADQSVEVADMVTLPVIPTLTTPVAPRHPDRHSARPSSDAAASSRASFPDSPAAAPARRPRRRWAPARYDASPANPSASDD